MYQSPRKFSQFEDVFAFLNVRGVRSRDRQTCVLAGNGKVSRENRYQTVAALLKQIFLQISANENRLTVVGPDQCFVIRRAYISLQHVVYASIVLLVGEPRANIVGWRRSTHYYVFCRGRVPIAIHARPGNFSTNVNC